MDPRMASQRDCRIPYLGILTANRPEDRGTNILSQTERRHGVSKLKREREGERDEAKKKPIYFVASPFMNNTFYLHLIIITTVITFIEIR